MLSEKCFVVVNVFSVPAGVYVGTLNSIASIPGPQFILTLELWGKAKYLLIVIFEES